MDDLTDDEDRGYRVVLSALGDGRWTASRKLAVLLALDRGEISEEEVCRRYAMHPDELSAWRRGKVYALQANHRRYADRISEGPSPTPLPSLTEAVSRSLGRAQRAILAEIDARPHNKIFIYNWHATIAPDVHATTQISKVLRSDRQWVDPIKRSSFSRALINLIRRGYLETVSLVPIIDSEGDPPFWLHHLSDGVCMRVPRDLRLYVRRSFSEN